VASLGERAIEPGSLILVARIGSMTIYEAGLDHDPLIGNRKETPPIGRPSLVFHELRELIFPALMLVDPGNVATPSGKSRVSSLWVVPAAKR
jgi:hypothetical protein